MQRAASIPLLLLIALTLPLHAQHGHAGGGFHAGGGGGFHSSGGGMHSGGFASHPAPPSRSFGGFNGAHSIHPGGPTRFSAPSRFAMPAHELSGRAFAPSYSLHTSRSLSPGARRPEYGSHRRPEYPDHHHPHRPIYNYGGTFYTGTVLPYGFYDPYWSSAPGFLYDNSYDAGADQAAYTNPAYDEGSNYVTEPAPEAAEPPNPADSNSPYSYGSPQPSTEPQAAPPPQEALTLVFSNGAPSQQIHNYILCRSTLTVLDGPRREIPIAELDLAATEKANRAAGIDFRLPQ